MANVLNEEKKQQVLALGRLGWSLRRIQQATHVRRETASAYLKAAEIAVCPPSGWGRRGPKRSNENEVMTDSAVVPSQNFPCHCFLRLVSPQSKRGLPQQPQSNDSTTLN